MVRCDFIGVEHYVTPRYDGSCSCNVIQFLSIDKYLEKQHLLLLYRIQTSSDNAMVCYRRYNKNK